MSVILLGLGRYVEEIVEVVSAISDVVLVERDEARLRAFLEKAPVANLRALPGSATDVGLWKEVDPEAAEAALSFLFVEGPSCATSSRGRGSSATPWASA